MFSTPDSSCPLAQVSGSATEAWHAASFYCLCCQKRRAIKKKGLNTKQTHPENMMWPSFPAVTNVGPLTERNVTLYDSVPRVAGLKMPLCSPHLCFLAVSERKGSRKLPVQAGVQSGENDCLSRKGDDKYMNVQSLGFWLCTLFF